MLFQSCFFNCVEAAMCSGNTTLFRNQIIYARLDKNKQKLFSATSTSFQIGSFKVRVRQSEKLLSNDLSDCNGTQTHHHLVHKQTLNHLAKLAKWLSCVVSTYLYNACDCMFLSCHVHVSEWIHTLQLPECQETPCLKQVQYLKFKWLQRDSNPQPLSS